MEGAASAPDREIVTRRVIPFPRPAVWRAWTEPEHLARWWGPAGFTNTFHAFDPRPGGEWRFTMHGPKGADYPNHSVFVDLTEPERIVFDHVSGHEFRVIATFGEVAGGTEVTFRQCFATARERDRIATFAVNANEQNLDRLEAELARMEREGADPAARP